MVRTIGIDIGSQTTTMIDHEGEIIRTSTGSIARPTVMALSRGSPRLFGDEAAVQTSNEYMLGMINLLCGKSFAEVDSMTPFQYTKYRLGADAASGENVVMEAPMGDGTEEFDVSSLLGMYLTHLWDNVSSSVSDSAADTKNEPLQLSFMLPPACSAATKNVYKEACYIAGIDQDMVHYVDMSDCVVHSYERKISALPAAERAQLLDKYVLLLDVGHTHCMLVVVQILSTAPQENTQATPKPYSKRPDFRVVKRAFSYSDQIGGFHFDIGLFKHLSVVAAARPGGEAVVPGTKRGRRLMNGCERLRKLLSQLPEASVTVENLSDAGDVSFTVTREELKSLCGDQVQLLQSMLREVVVSAGVSIEDIVAIEALGGGMRMHTVQVAVLSVFTHITALGAKLDDSSVAIGAALAVRKQKDDADAAAATAAAPTSTETEVGAAAAAPAATSPTEVAVELPLEPTEALRHRRERELQLRQVDTDQRAMQALRNKMEAYLLEMRSAPSRKHGQSIDIKALNDVIDEYESWMWDNEAVALAELQSKYDELCGKVGALCETYLQAVTEEKKTLEAQLEAESAAAAAQKQEEGGDEDHDTRKLRKPDRMRLVVKNKEEGTELFKGGSIRPAAARYHKALTHAAKFFDLTPEDVVEVNSIKLSLYLNLASCYIKLQSWEQVLRNCTDALALDENNMKALFRRSAYFEHKKDWVQALADVKRCEQIAAAAGTEDKLVAKASERIKKEMAKEKAKEKSMWGKAFAAN